MGDSILGRMDEMGQRMDELEQSIAELMDQAGLEPSAGMQPTTTTTTNSRASPRFFDALDDTNSTNSKSDNVEL